MFRHLFIAAFLLTTLPHAETESPKKDKITMAPVIHKTKTAVVNIKSTKVISKPMVQGMMEDPIFQFFQDFYDKKLTEKSLEKTLGTGVIVDPKGLIVTCYHVIKQSEDIEVTLSDNRTFKATLEKIDPNNDLALLKLTGIPKDESLPFIELEDYKNTDEGDYVLAIGFPFGIGKAISSGIISSLARPLEKGFVIQTDASINPGNSGGALVNSQGLLVGVPKAIYSKTGASHGVGFVVPSQLIKALITNPARNGKLLRAWSGMGMQDVTQEIAKTLDRPLPGGAIVNYIHAQSPAKDKIKIGDIITHFEDDVIDDADDFNFRIKAHPLNGPARIELIRNGKKEVVNLHLNVAPGSDIHKEVTLTGHQALDGLTVANLTPALAEDFDIRNDHPGVVVVGESKNFFSHRISATGDIIQKVNDHVITDAAQLQDLIKDTTQDLTVEIRRGDKVFRLEFKVKP